MLVNMSRVQVAVLVAILFILVGWMTPVVWASYTPDSSIATVSNFDVQNATVGADQTRVCFTREIHYPQTTEVFTRVILVNDDSGVEREVLRYNFERFFSKGTETVSSTLPLNPMMEPGKYYYEVTVTFNMANDRVTREISTKSEPFYIKEDPQAGDGFTCT